MIDYDDSNLHKLIEDLQLQKIKIPLRGAFKKTANLVRKDAIKNLRSSIRSDRDLENGVRSEVYKKRVGFYVTIGTIGGKKKKFDMGEVGIHTNRRGLKKPVLPWAELGTKPRYTKTKTRIYTRMRKGHYTGRMPEFGFMAKTKEEVKGWVTDELRNSIVKTIQRKAKKYGCS